MDATSPDLLEIAAASLDSAQTEHAEAEICLVEASARAEEAQTAVSRLLAAVAALKGEIPERPPAKQPVGEYIVAEAMKRTERADTAEMSPEEFDRERKRRQRVREKEEIANNPLAHIKCAGCGVLGKMSDQVHTTSGGGVVRMMVCAGCGNQIIT